MAMRGMPMIRASTAISTSPRITSLRVMSRSGTPRAARDRLVIATMKPAMKKKPGATGTPVKRVRNCQKSAAAAGGTAASSSPGRPALYISEAWSSAMWAISSPRNRST